MRIFFKDGPQITEITKQINSYKSDTYLMTLTPSDAIYIATDFPMNHLFIKMGYNANVVNASLSVHYYGSQGWAASVNTNDYTNCFLKSGFVEFTPNKDVPWLLSNTNSNGQSVDGLEGVTVYEQYWTKLTVNQSLTENIELEYIGHKFSEDEDLFSEFPIFNDSSFLAGFEAGKTNWEEQAIKAADLIIQDLIKKSVIIGPEQILNRNVLLPASVCKVAEIIFNAFGRDYVEQRLLAKEEYARRLDLSRYVVDQNNNGVIEPVDVRFKQGWLSR